MKIFVTDSTGALHQVEGETVVVELENGKTLELGEFNYRPDAPHAITIWGGRQPLDSWTEEDRHLSEQLNLTLIAGNCVDVWPGRAKKQK
ncbi:DM13 domain-containing protein [Scandinavium sp. TWS1a]|uniref:hypothetical protein n=1 Tax=Scandinavium tedordense TaxID=2926521 RepID=UPI001359B748|nr:hypothetical protein [Scandinavium tedordense]MCS2169771.1 DM13 domain-containing protein [Scandinavium tedordense]